jgi:hypothetical protein
MPPTVTALAMAGLLLCVGLASPAAAQNVRPFPRIGFDDDGEGGQLARHLSSPDLKAIPIAVRLPVDGALRQDPDVAGIEARVAALARAGLQVWLHIVDVPAADDSAAVRRWRGFVRTIVERTRGQVQLVELPLASGSPASTAQERVFLLKVAAVQVRAVDSGLLVAVHGDRIGDPEWVAAFYGADAAPYVDVLSLPAPSSAGTDTAVALGAQLGGLDPDTRVVISGEPLSEVTDARRTLVRTQLERLGSAVACTTYRGSPVAVAAAMPGVMALRDLLVTEIVTLDAGGAALAMKAAAPGAAIHARLLYNVATFATYLAYWTDSATETGAEVSVRLARAGSPMIREPLTGSVQVPAALTRDDASGVTRLHVTASSEPRIVDFDHGAANEFALADRTEARRELSVQEIIARHQQAQAAQDDLLESYSARGRMQQHFRPTPADPGYDVVTESRYFSSRDGIEWEELSFSVNGTKWGPDRPAFPLLQAEKVLALPLDVRLTADYTYRLEGVETVDSRPCYVIAFEPRTADRSLYRGRVWIDRERFARLKLQTVQTRLASPMVSSEEIQTFSPVRDAAGREFFLFSRLTGRQIVLIAGRNLLLEKDVRFSEFRVNDPTFAGTREEARRSDRIMFKETDRGLRHYVKENDGERQVSDRLTSRAKALAMGVTIDPAFGFPLPIVGLNYIDFDFGHKDTQLALLFGGVLALGNIQRAKLFGGRVDASVDFFAIAVPGSDRLFDVNGEREAERVLTWPLNIGGNLGWQFTEFQKLGIQYVFRFDAYVHDRTTAEDYELPASTVTNGTGLTYEWRRAGYGLTASALWARRAVSRPWGPAGALEPGQPDYAKYSLGLSKDIYFGAFQKVHLNGAYFGGQRLDRFTRYQFGLFDDTRMHGVPSAGVRFGELIMARGSYSFNVFDQYRLELFLDRAFGRASPGSGTWEGLTGTGASFTMRTPFRTMLRADVGKSFLPEASRATGSVVVQILVLKPL